MKKVLFLCTGNSARSPMAEVLLCRTRDQIEARIKLWLAETDSLAITDAAQRRAAFTQIAQRLRIRIEHFLVTLAHP